MLSLKRFEENPILTPVKQHDFEQRASFNPCVLQDEKITHIFYRALSENRSYFGRNMGLSTIGHATSMDGIHFQDRTLLIKPELEWERFGCEDPRVTKIDDKYYIFYTALSEFPPVPSGIKIGVAVSSDLKNFEKHQVTHFNSKAMVLFPRKINGKLMAILTINTDMPPAKIAVADFDNESQIWSKDYWDKWALSIDLNTLPLQRTKNDHIEVGAVPVETEYGWIFIYSYITNYFSPPATFGIEAVLMDANDPLRVIGRTSQPLLTPQADYELHGDIQNVIFPTGAMLDGDDFMVYYGAADTTACMASCKIELLIKQMLPKKPVLVQKLERFEDNPIIEPIPTNYWESKATFNPGAFHWGGKVHFLYRAMSQDNTSVFGYASSLDGFHIDKRLDKPVYIPREEFEQKSQPGNSGCEDPRITKIGDTLYICYTAYNGNTPPRVALTSISIDDFLSKRWNFSTPILISLPNVSDKDACIFPEKIKGKYMILHRIEPNIWIDFVDDLKFEGNKLLDGNIFASPTPDKWDSDKIGIAGPPLETSKGWLLIYHGISKQDHKYRLGAMLLDLDNPTDIIARTDSFILEPQLTYEKTGIVGNAVFSCGSAIVQNTLFVYYGAADRVIGVATANLDDFLDDLLA